MQQPVAGNLAALALGRGLAQRLGSWNAVLAGGALYLVAVLVIEAVMPGIDEVPELAAAAAVAGCTSPAAANRTAVHAAASRFIVTKVIPSYSS